MSTNSFGKRAAYLPVALGFSTAAAGSRGTSFGLAGKPIGYRQCAVFARLQGDFLSKHHVACGQTAIRHKTPTRLGMSRIVHLVHVHTRTMVDALSAVATDDIEVVFSVELRALLR
jgi:hypothetical protein